MGLGALILAAGSVSVMPSIMGPGNHTIAPRAKWVTAVTAGGPAVTDNATARILNIASINVASRILLRMPDGATRLAVRLGYDDGITLSVDPVIQVFGVDGLASTDQFGLLHNCAGTPLEEVTLTAAETTDVTDGTLKYTEVLPTTHLFDLQGYQFILIGVKTAIATGAGDVTNSIIQAKAQ